MDQPREPGLTTANAAFVTDQLLVGGDLDTRDTELATSQLGELVEAGVTHVVDTRIEWDDQGWVAERAPEIGYLHHGMDDAGQRVPGEWFDVGVSWALEAMEGGGVVLTHCHMGINRGPSLGFAIMLAQDWDLVEALDAIRAARPIAWIAYAEDALRWHHERRSSPPADLERDRERLVRWRADNELDMAEVIRKMRVEGY
jgi:dual specificity phosphatase 3